MDNLEYKAGVTADGYGIAPADEMPPALSADDFQQIEMSLDIPVADYIAEDTINFNPEETELEVGRIIANAKTGGVVFNGRDISSADPALLNPDCW